MKKLIVLLLVLLPAISFSGDIIFLPGGGTNWSGLQNSIIPNADDAYDIGSSSYEWKDGYFDGTVHVDELDVNGVYSLPTVDGTSGQCMQTDGSGTLSWTDVSGLTITQVLKPTVSSLTAANATNTVVNNYGQSAADIYVTLPPAAEGMSFTVAIGTAQAGNVWAVQAAGADVIYLDGVAGSAGGFVETTPVVGTAIRITSFKTGASTYSWLVTTLSGTWSALGVFNINYEDDNNIVYENGDNLIVS